VTYKKNLFIASLLLDSFILYKHYLNNMFDDPTMRVLLRSFHRNNTQHIGSWNNWLGILSVGSRVDSAELCFLCTTKYQRHLWWEAFK